MSLSLRGGPSPVLAQTTCNTDGHHWYGRATSGTGSLGTAIHTNMPANFYAPSGTATDEAAWYVDLNTLGSSGSAVELGWVQGFWSYTNNDYGKFFTGPVAYYTINDGVASNDGWVLTGYLPASTSYEFQIANYGGDIQVSDLSGSGPGYAANIPYQVTGTRWNMSQGEVAGGQGAWMGGNNGSGTTSWGYWETGTGAFSPWGYLSMCDNSPYWITQKSSNSWKNGGS